MLQINMACENVLTARNHLLNSIEHHQFDQRQFTLKFLN